MFPAATCAPLPADGIRVYQPGSTQSLFIKGAGAGTGDVCSSTTEDQMSVGAFASYG